MDILDTALAANLGDMQIDSAAWFTQAHIAVLSTCDDHAKLMRKRFHSMLIEIDVGRMSSSGLPLVASMSSRFPALHAVTGTERLLIERSIAVTTLCIYA